MMRAKAEVSHARASSVWLAPASSSAANSAQLWGLLTGDGWSAAASGGLFCDMTYANGVMLY